MASKLEAARIASWSGVPTVIANAARAGVLAAAAAGRVGRHPLRGPPPQPRGAQAVDRLRRPLARRHHRRRRRPAGARRAQEVLLPAGVVSVEGRFVDGDTVEVRAVDGTSFARGMVFVDAAQLRKVMGHADPRPARGRRPRGDPSRRPRRAPDVRSAVGCVDCARPLAGRSPPPSDARVRLPDRRRLRAARRRSPVCRPGLVRRRAARRCRATRSATSTPSRRSPTRTVSIGRTNARNWPPELVLASSATTRTGTASTSSTSARRRSVRRALDHVAPMIDTCARQGLRCRRARQPRLVDTLRRAVRSGRGRRLRRAARRPRPRGRPRRRPEEHAASSAPTISRDVIGFDFAVVEECGSTTSARPTPTCSATTSSSSSTPPRLRRGVRSVGDSVSVVLRDVAVSTPDVTATSTILLTAAPASPATPSSHRACSGGFRRRARSVRIQRRLRLVRSRRLPRRRRRLLAPASPAARSASPALPCRPCRGRARSAAG